MIDIENLAGGAVTGSACRDIWQMYATRLSVGTGDHVVVATGPETAPAAWFSLPGWIRRVVGPVGPDGADLAILAAVDLEHVARRFGTLVIGSGDGIFAPLARAAAARGIEVTQVYGKGRTSTALYLACPRNIHLRNCALQPQSAA